MIWLQFTGWVYDRPWLPNHPHTQESMQGEEIDGTNCFQMEGKPQEFAVNPTDKVRMYLWIIYYFHFSSFVFWDQICFFLVIMFCWVKRL